MGSRRRGTLDASPRHRNVRLIRNKQFSKQPRDLSIRCAWGRRSMYSNCQHPSDMSATLPPPFSLPLPPPPLDSQAEERDRSGEARPIQTECVLIHGRQPLRNKAPPWSKQRHIRERKKEKRNKRKCHFPAGTRCVRKAGEGDSSQRCHLTTCPVDLKTVTRAETVWFWRSSSELHLYYCQFLSFLIYSNYLQLKF